MKIIIFALPRTASHFLSQSLASKYGIENFNEIFNERIPEKRRKDIICNFDSGIIKIQPSHFLKYQSEAMDLMENSKIVVIQPRDMFETCTSFLFPGSTAKDDTKYWNVNKADGIDNNFVRCQWSTISEKKSKNILLWYIEEVKRFIVILPYILSLDTKIITFEDIVSKYGSGGKNMG